MKTTASNVSVWTRTSPTLSNSQHQLYTISLTLNISDCDVVSGLPLSNLSTNANFFLAASAVAAVVIVVTVPRFSELYPESQFSDSDVSDSDSTLVVFGPWWAWSETGFGTCSGAGFWFDFWPGFLFWFWHPFWADFPPGSNNVRQFFANTYGVQNYCQFFYKYLYSLHLKIKYNS